MRRKKFTRIFTAFLTAGVIATSTLPVTIQQVYADNTYQYTIGESTLSYLITDSDEITISGYTGTESSIIIPSEIDGKKVTEIGDEAFYRCTSLTNIIIPNSVTHIGRFSFLGCTNLESIIIPDSVIHIGRSSFSGCTNLKSIIIPNSVKEIGDCAFCNCESLTNIIIPDSITQIAMHTFSGCTKLVSITIPDSVKEIESGAFDNCVRLTNITIPDSVTKIGSYAFDNCRRLTNIVIPNSVTQIGGCAFEYCLSLTSIVIPNSVTQIGDRAFACCTDLTNITFSDNLTCTGDYAFLDCTGLTSVTIPDTITEIGQRSFSGCTNLTSVIIPDSVTEIGPGAFSDCIGLKNITIPDSVTSIGVEAFSGCTGLTSFTIPKSVIYIGGGAFRHCTRLTNIIVDEYNENYVSIDDVLFDKNMNKLLFYPTMKSSSYTIPNSVTEIGRSAFEDCIRLTNITIPDSVTQIGMYAFSDCIGLTSVSIPDSVTQIGEAAFMNCKNLENIIIQDSVEYIATNAFNSCINLRSIIIPNSVTQIGNSVFYNCINLKSVIIPDSVIYFGIDVFKNDSEVVIYGITGSNAEWYANKYDIPFEQTEIKDPLKVTFSGNKATLIKGESVTLTANATGGKPEYTYRYSIVNPETGDKVNLTDFVNNNTYVWNATKVGERELYVEIKDTSSNILKSKAVKVVCKEKLSVKATIPTTEVAKGSTLKVSAQATGGKPEYTYRYSIVNPETGAKLNLTEFIKSNTYVWNATKAGKKQLYVEVKDSSSNIVKSNVLNVVCSETSEQKLSVKATVPTTEVAKGSTLKVSAQATGGKPGYTYRYSIVNPETGAKLNLTEFIKSNTYVWNATKAGKKQLYVEVKDSSSNIVKSNVLNVVCSETSAQKLSVKATVPTTEVAKGSTLKISAQATGGKPGYTYRYSIVNPKTGAKLNLTEFIENNTYVWNATKAGKKQLYVEVKDTSGKIVKSNIVDIVVI